MSWGEIKQKVRKLWEEVKKTFAQLENSIQVYWKNTFTL